jgi:hypothetical protein
VGRGGPLLVSIETIIYFEIKCVGLYGRNTIDLPLSDYRSKTHKSGTLIGKYVNAANHIRRKIIMCTPGPTSTNLVKFICYNYDPVGTLLKQGKVDAEQSLPPVTSNRYTLA